MTVDPSMIEAFRRDGAVMLRGVADPDWLERLRAGVAENIARPGPYGITYTGDGAAGLYFGDYCNWQRIAAFRDFVVETEVARTSAALLGTAKLNLFHEHVLVKDPGTAERTPWHHDQPYWTVDGEQVGSTWIALDPVPQTVAMEFVAGSHRWGTAYRPRYFGSHADYEDRVGPSVPDIDARRDEYRILSWALEAGDAVAFHARTLHAAPGNPGPHRRRAIAFRWTGDDARFARREGQMSPPFPDIGLKHGEPMDSPTFPVVWPPERRTI